MTDYLIGAGVAWLLGFILCVIADSDIRDAVIRALWTVLCAPFYFITTLVVWAWQWVPGHDRLTWFKARPLSTEALARFARRAGEGPRPWVVTWRRGAVVVLRAPASAPASPAGGGE